MWKKCAVIFFLVGLINTAIVINVNKTFFLAQIENYYSILLVTVKKKIANKGNIPNVVSYIRSNI